MTPVKTTKNTNTNTITNTNKPLGFDRFSFSLLFLLGFLVPVFFLPFLNISTEVSKSILISTFVAIAFFLWLIARLKDGNFVFPKSIVLAAGALVPIAFFFSSAFSEIPKVSFVGLGYESGTFTYSLVFFVLMFLSSIFFQKRSRISQLYSVVLFSAVIVFIYQLIRFIFISFGLPFVEVFSSLPENLVGKWADMAIFFGLAMILSLVTLELVSLSKKIKALMYATLVSSLLVLIIVNMKLVWIVVGFFSLIIFVYTVSFGTGHAVKGGERKIPAIPFAILLLSMFFVLAGGVVGDFIYSSVKVPQEILRPTWGQTFEVAKESLADNPVFGIGPNRFGNLWSSFKPAEVNSSLLWNIGFDTGVGFIPSVMITSGGIGILAWLIFLFMFLYRGIRSIFIARSSGEYRYAMLSSFILALYLWIFSFFYVPNVAIIFFAFLMTGVFIASLTQSGVIKNYNFSFLEDPRIGFVSVLVLILLIISSIAGSYLLFQKFLSIGYFQRSIVALSTTKDLNKAESNIIQAIKLGKSDLYYRTLADINIARLRGVLSEKNISKETVRTKFTSISRKAIQYAAKATEIDDSNYLNWLTLARVYGSLMQFGASEGFYQSAQQAYSKALILSPRSPSIALEQARLEVSAGNRKLAKEYIAKALNLKNNYTQAIFLLSQIQADEGNLKDAITSAEVASIVSPNDMSIFFQLGLLRYKNNEYEGAISAFERAVELNPNYSNARYFLGLSYSKNKERSKAIEQFKQILVLNPNNKEINKILRNLKNGRSPLSSVKESDNLPIKEE